MVWDASIILAEYFSSHPELVRGKRCLEMGAGLGLGGIVAAANGAKEVVITDVADYLPILRENVAGNLLDGFFFLMIFFHDVIMVLQWCLRVGVYVDVCSVCMYVYVSCSVVECSVGG